MDQYLELLKFNLFLHFGTNKLNSDTSYATIPVMNNLSYIEIRKKYLEFLKARGHAEIAGASLVPENDPSVLFVNAGMFPLVPFLLGEKHPLGTRLTNVQRSLRTGDIDEVGDAAHCTTFEMLGNWSLNDYFKEEAINISVDFMTQVLGYEMKDIYASTFVGDDSAPKDTEAQRVWMDIFKKFGIDAKIGKGERIQEFDKSCNWWELEAGGPCGPDSEFFFDTGKEKCGPDCDVSCNCGKYVELGNNVFMEYLKKDGKYLPLGKHNVDFGGGLDRLAMFAQGKNNVFEVDIYHPILQKVQELSKEQIIFSQRVVVDHIKAATWIIMDGVVPGRTQQSYILRRLIRRAIRHGKKLGIEGLFTRKVGEVACDQFSPIYPDLATRKAEILSVLEEEEVKFNKTLADGLKEMEKIMQKVSGDFDNSDGTSFKLFETYGFPAELFIEELKAKGLKVDEQKFMEEHNKAMEEHQEKSRTASKGLFKGGLADTSEMSTKYHTAQHLLLAAMRKLVGDHIIQKGSNITTERLRFDFPSPDKLSDEQVKAVEELVNEQIQKALPVSYVEMPKAEALKLVPFAAFSEKYAPVVKVYTIGDRTEPFSVEICNGPHVDNTSKLGKFKIVKQENIGAGLRRIKAVLE